MINEYMISTFSNAVFMGSFISNAPFGFVFHFALMQNEIKDQD